jgi:signal transduction histidine kinase
VNHKKTEENKNNYVIMVSDDGVGFEERNYKNDGAIHVGLANIRWRLETMMDAQLEINSEPGKGTTAIIRIPKRRD